MLHAAKWIYPSFSAAPAAFVGCYLDYVALEIPVFFFSMMNLSLMCQGLLAFCSVKNLNGLI